MDFLTSSDDLQLADIVLRMLAAAVLGGGIGVAYRQTFRGVTYSTSFRNTSVLITIIICAIILSIGSNVALSLGLVGSLSVIRFRTVVKDAMDMVYLFWSIGAGIACGAGQFHIALVLFGFVLAVLLFLVFNPFRAAERDRFMLKLVYEDRAEAGRIVEALRERYRDVTLRSSFRNARNQTTEATYLVKLAEAELPSAEEILAGREEGVLSAQLVKFDGMSAL